MNTSSKSFRIVTLGCKVNQYESACVGESLTRVGWVPAGKGEKADLTVVNTCVVTQRASYQSRQAIRKALRENPSGKVVAVGCYGQAFPEELLDIPGVALVVGNTMKGKLPDILSEERHSASPRIIRQEFGPRAAFDESRPAFLGERARAFLKIQDGCESFCSYCIVPRARGPLRSLPPSEVLSGLRAFSEKGYREVVLTGIHLGKYGGDLEPGLDLKGLVGLVGRQSLPIRIRLSSIEPNEVTPELIDLMAEQEWLCRHFHIPLQSGDDRVLQRMNRTYKSREFGTLIRRIHDRIPLAAIGVDVMVGFPGEDERAYGNTLSLIQDLPVSYLHVFPFSPRKGTPAAGFTGQVPSRLIKERVIELRSVGYTKRLAFYNSCVGKEFWVVAEGRHPEKKGLVKGLSDNYLPVHFSSHDLRKGSLVKVSTDKVEGGAVMGTRVMERRAFLLDKGVVSI